MADETFTTDQERFWAGDFGNEYSRRNADGRWVTNNRALFSKVFADTGHPSNVLELGSNVGLNLAAIKAIDPRIRLSAVEINAQAAATLKRNLPEVELFQRSLLEFRAERTWDMVFCKGVLIHVAPDQLSRAYEALYRHAARHVLLAEYYSPSPVEVPYRGFRARLFKRDFCGEMLDRYSDLELLSYGFAYHRDPRFPQDDLNWFVLAKKG